MGEQSVSWTMTRESVIVVLDGTTHTVKKGDLNYEKVRRVVYDDEMDKLPALVSKGKAIEAWTGGKFVFKDNFIWYDGEKVPSAVSKKMLSMAASGDSPEPLFKFWERLQANPSWRSVNMLFGFLENHGIPIDNDGYLLTYKSVTRDYKDHHSKTVDNSIGSEPWMNRNKISDDYEVPCHTGFHVGNLRYAQGFRSGGRLIICKVDPADVVCVSKTVTDKMRVCRYKVIGNHGDRLPEGHFDHKATRAEIASTPVEVLDVDIEDGDEQDSPAEDRRGELLAMGSGDLRKYATSIGVERASKISGGMSVLASIVEAQEKTNAGLDEIEDLDDDEYDDDELDDDDIDPLPHLSRKEAEDIRDNVVAAQSPEEWMTFDSLTQEQLETKNLGPLRKYAALKLNIVGASKIKGGKNALLLRIKDVRSE